MDFFGAGLQSMLWIAIRPNVLNMDGYGTIYQGVATSKFWTSVKRFLHSADSSPS